MKQDLIYPELSYKLNGIFYQVHNALGRFRTEKQYADFIEKLLKKYKIKYLREYELSNLGKDRGKGSRVDFVIENKILVDVKAKKFITKDDYFQMRRYLDVAKMKLGLIVNFRNTYLKPKRVLNPNIKIY